MTWRKILPGTKSPQLGTVTIGACHNSPMARGERIDVAFDALIRIQHTILLMLSASAQRGRASRVTSLQRDENSADESLSEVENQR
jgi:hypothetical protein